MAEAEMQLLRGAMKKDPKAYTDELLLQLRHFQASIDIFKTRPSKANPELSSVISLLSHVTPCYPKELSEFPSQLVQLLEEYHPVMETNLRKELSQCVLMLRNRNLLSAVSVSKLFFQMFRCQDKKLRAALASHIVSDVKKINTGKVDNKTNKELQNFLFKLLQDRNATAAKTALEVIVKLYKKKVWQDAKTVNVVASACFSTESKVRATALNFFLGVDDQQAALQEQDSDDEELDARELQQAAGNKDSKGKSVAKVHSKRSRKRLLQARRALNSAKKKDSSGSAPPAFAALDLLDDPQGFTERLLAVLRKSTDKFEVKLLMMNLISRVINTHELLVLSFYPFVQKYMQPHQTKVTNILAFAAQAVHPLVPPDVIEPVIRTLANHFITDGRQDEVIAIGLNTVREICMRQPHAIEADLLQDLVQYKKHKDKGVVIAARSLLALYRGLDSEMLAKKDRGKVKDHHKRLDYGNQRVADGVEGLELLDMTSDSSEEDDSDEEEDATRTKRVSFGASKERKIPSKDDVGDDGNQEESGEPREFKKGDRVEARWEGSEEFHPGQIRARNPDGTYHIEYDDGDVDKKVPSTHVREENDNDDDDDDDDGEEESEDEEEAEEGGSASAMEGSGERQEFKKGDRVEARWEGSEEFHPGQIRARNPDGTYHIEFDDGDVDKNTPADHVRENKEDGEEDDDDEEEEEEEGEEMNVEGDGGDKEADGAETGEDGAGKGGEGGEADLMRLDALRPLTEEEFDKIRRMKTKDRVQELMGKKRKTGTGIGPDSESLETKSRLDGDALMGQHKKRRLDKAGRLASIMEGREGREGAWKDKHERKRQAGGLRNEEAAKNKPFLMVKGSFKVRSKLKASKAEQNNKAKRAKKQQRGHGGGKAKDRVQRKARNLGPK